MLCCPVLFSHVRSNSLHRELLASLQLRNWNLFHHTTNLALTTGAGLRLEGFSTTGKLLEGR